MSHYKKYYPEFFDPADIDGQHMQSEKWTLSNGFPTSNENGLDNSFAEFLWLNISSAASDIDEVYDESDSGEVIKKPYAETRTIFESIFEELEELCINEVFNNSPLVIDELVWNFSFSKRVSMLYCYGLYCIDSGLKDYSTSNSRSSSQALSYGVSAIGMASSMKLLSLQGEDTVKSNSSKAGRAKAAKYQPLKEQAKKLVQSRSWQSRRNAAKTITPEILELAKKLSISLSHQQAELTIAGWLKDEGLPAKI